MNLEILSARYDNASHSSYTVTLRCDDLLDGEPFPYGVVVGRAEDTALYAAIMERMSEVEIQEYVEPVIPDEALAARARAKRDGLLSASDYLVMPDYPISAEGLEAVKAYRQALRDLPLQSGFPRNIEWPKKGEIV